MDCGSAQKSGTHLNEVALIRQPEAEAADGVPRPLPLCTPVLLQHHLRRAPAQQGVEGWAAGRVGMGVHWGACTCERGAPTQAGFTQEAGLCALSVCICADALVFVYVCVCVCVSV